jgi:hypothetical protein
VNNLKLVYCFSKSLSVGKASLDVVLYCLAKSVDINSKFHDVKIFTDLLTIQVLSHIRVKKEVINYSPLKFVDDIKIQSLPLLEDNEILIDPDIFLYKELVLDTDCDVIGEHQDLLKSDWYTENWDKASSYNFSKNIKFSSISGKVTNIGILKFFNREFQSQYLQRYNFVRDLAIEQEEKIGDLHTYSILLGQLLLQNIIDEYTYKARYTSQDSRNSYIHLAGLTKYDLGGRLEEYIERRFYNTHTI